MAHIVAKGFDSNQLLGLAVEPPLSVSVDSRVLTVTPEWATEHLERWHYDLQRSLMRHNVDRLVEEMLHGRFVPATPVFVCQIPDKSRFIVNGRHTLTAVAESGIPIRLTFITLQVADLSAVGRVYGCFDIHRVRSYAASWKAYKGSDDVTVLEKRALPGILFILSGFDVNNTVVSRDDRFNALTDYIEHGALEVLSNAFDLGGHPGTKEVVRAVQRAGVMAIALFTARHQASLAHEFWRNVVTEAHPDSNHPSRALARYLRSAKGAGSAFQREDLAQTAAAWNRAWDDKRVGYFKPGSVKTFRILGTPWHKGNPEAYEEA